MPYSPQADPAQEQVLRQNTGNQAGIIKTVLTARNHYNGSITDAGRDERNWKLLVNRVDKVVCQMPLWKLQTVGGERLDFLYENSGSGTRIMLKPGITFCFRKHYPLVADMVKGAWARYVRRFNSRFLHVNASIIFPTESWHSYQLQYKNALTDPSWSNLGGHVGGNDTPASAKG